MSHGTPDWGVTAGGATVYQMTDLAELAVRLGSIVSFDRRGDVVYLEDFEQGFGDWTHTAIGDGASVALSFEFARSRALSVLLTSGFDSERLAGIGRGFPIPALSNLGLEHSFNPQNLSGHFRLEANVNTGTRYLELGLRWVATGELLQYRTGTDSWHTIASGLKLDTLAKGFGTWKLVFDPIAEEYIRAIVNSTEYDLSGIAVQGTGDTSTPELGVDIYVESEEDSNDELYVDDFIYTQNEPA